MLILTRRKGEAIIVGGDVTVSVLSIEGSQVRLGIVAPKSVEVHRDEVYRRINSNGANLTHAQRSNLQGIGDPIVREIV
jgi:carbon storage regulator